MKVNFNVLNQKSAPALYESSLANRPTAGYIGRLFIDTDIPSTGIYWDSGTAWYKIASASIAETQSLNDVCVIGNSTVTLGTYIFGQSTYGQKSGAAIPVEPDYALTIGRGNSVNDKSLYVAFNSILNGLVNVIGGNTASNPGLKVSGGWFTGGSATTTKPQLLVEPDSTTSTAWSTLGTGLGINAATGFTGRLFDFQINAVSKAVLLANGNLLIGTTTDSGYKLDVNGTARISSNLEITSNTGITFGGGASVLSYSGNNLIIGNAAAWTSIKIYVGIVEKITATATTTTFTNSTINLSSLAIQLAGVDFATDMGARVLGMFNTKPATTYWDKVDFYTRNIAGTGVISLYRQTNLGIKIGINTDPNISSILDVESTTKGFLLPRMTTVQKTAIATPAAGLMVYDTTLNKLCVFTTAWETITSL